MESFVLSKESHFILYGAASCGSLLCDKLLCQGYKVDAFIDKRADEIVNLKGISVYNLEDAAKKFCDRKFVIVIAVKNVFEHSRIAMELAENGLKNILYKPYSVLKGRGTECERIIEKWYDKIAIGDLPEERQVLRRTEISNIYLQDEKEYLLAEKEDYIVISLPLVCLFENLELNATSQERNALYFFPHIQFFSYLQGEDKASVDYYMDYCEKAAAALDSFKVTEAWKRNVIENRTEICNEMNNSYYFKQSFFIDNAPHVIWNEKGYFNLNSGKHRTAFWASKKMMFMPVKMDKTEAECWINRKRALLILEKMNQKKIYTLKAPVEHPMFYQYPCASALFFQGLLFKIAETISRIYYSSPTENYINNKKVYLSVDDLGLLSRCLRRCGAQVYERNTEDKEWIRLLDDLFYLKERNRISEVEEYDIGVIKVVDSKMAYPSDKMYIKNCFYIVPENIVRETLGLQCIYQGIAWDKKMCVLYQGVKNV